MPKSGAEDTAKDMTRHLQGDWAEHKCLGSDERPSQHVLVMFPPWSKATPF